MMATALRYIEMPFFIGRDGQIVKNQQESQNAPFVASLLKGAVPR